MTPALDTVRREELRKRAEAAHVHGWRCPFCSCQTFARFDELGQHGYAPGDDVRCVSCKHESYWPRFNETADTTLALLAYIAELEAGLKSRLTSEGDAPPTEGILRPLADRGKSADALMDQASEKRRHAAALITDAEAMEQLAYDTADYCGGGEP